MRGLPRFRLPQVRGDFDAAAALGSPVATAASSAMAVAVAAALRTALRLCAAMPGHAVNLKREFSSARIRGPPLGFWVSTKVAVA